MFVVQFFGQSTELEEAHEETWRKEKETQVWAMNQPKEIFVCFV